MKHSIDATNDFAFAMLFAVEANKGLLIDFLNQTLQLDTPIDDITLENSQNLRKFKQDKLTVVDVLARDTSGAIYQVEVQVLRSIHLNNRMLYYWSNLYDRQLSKGERYDLLRPVYSIWLLCENLLSDMSKYHDIYGVCSLIDGRLLTDHMAIHVLELKKYSAPDTMNPLQQWLCFFKESHNWLKLPNNLTHPILRQAMNVLEDISDKEENYFQYIAFKNAMIERNTQEHLRQQAIEQMEQAKQELDKIKQETVQFKEKTQQAQLETKQAQLETKQAKQESEQAKQEALKAMAENERLKALLLEAGIEPDK